MANFNESDSKPSMNQLSGDKIADWITGDTRNQKKNHAYPGHIHLHNFLIKFLGIYRMALATFENPKFQPKPEEYSQFC